MKCVVTGAAGFVGSSLIDELLLRGDEVVGIDCFVDYYPREVKESNLTKAKQYQKFKFVEADLEFCNIAPLLDGVDWIFHLAAQAGVRASWGKDFSIYTGKNILATQRLLEAAKTANIRSTLKKLVYASSSSVYGNAETLPTIESLKPQPVSPYGVSKLAAEHLVVLYDKAFGVHSVSLRYFTVYGPRQRPDMAFHLFSKAALLGNEIQVYGDGEQSRDFTFISDIVTANIAAAECAQSGLVCNIGGGCRVTVNEVIGMMESIIGKKIAVKHVSRQAGDARHTSADTKLAMKYLSYSPKVSLHDGLDAELKWMENKLSSSCPGMPPLSDLGRTGD